MALILGRRKLILAVVICLIVAALVAFGLHYRGFGQALQVINAVGLRYVDPVSITQLFGAYLRTGKIPKMLATLHDPYTRYMTPREYADLQVQTDGSFGGIGVTLNVKGKTPVVIKTTKGSPSERAGLRRGDRITRVNGSATSKMSIDDAVAAIRGPAGTAVRLTIARGEGKNQHLFDVKVIRANIYQPSVETEIIKKEAEAPIAFITISSFAERTAKELEAALESGEKAGMKGIVLDLRYNPGGLLDAAISVASKFLDDGPVMFMLRRDGQREELSVEDSQRWHYPLVILVNQYSASASEIVSGALKDRGVAALVGAKTFGKGVVQEIVPLGGGAALSVTVAKYLTAGGNSINKVGIQPDIKVDIPGAMDRALKSGEIDELLKVEEMQRERALTVLRAEIAGQLAEAS